MEKKIEFLKKMKRRIYFRIGLQVVVLLLTMGYRGIPGDPLQILLQVLQSVVAAISGAIIYNLFLDLKAAISLQRKYQQADSLSNGHNSQ